MTARQWLALDIGGANLKAAHSAGFIRSIPFALWKSPRDLPRELGSLASQFPPFDRIAATMTGELCDCFATKAEGVKTILAAVREVFGGRAIAWGTDGRFRSLGEAASRPDLTAASNWSALATVAARLVPEGLLIDIGSTTSDLIPLRGGLPKPTGRTDAGRLRAGELIYAGVRRTPICALATALPHRNHPTGLMAELFATTWDVYLTLGEIEGATEDRSTADGRPATREFARDRLARMVGEDRETFSDSDAISLAREADSVLVERLVSSARRLVGGTAQAAILSGSGEFLARKVAERIITAPASIVSLSELWGRSASDAACAQALMLLASETDGVAPK